MSGVKITPRAVEVAKEVYRGYVPVALPQHAPPRKVKPWHKVYGRPRITIYPPKPIEGYSEKPEYPPLNDGSVYGVHKLQKRLDWYEQIKALPTWDQKMEEIGKHIRHNIVHFPPWMSAYNSLPMGQYLTRTHVINNLPDRYLEGGCDDDLVVKVRDFILAQVELENFQSIQKPPKFWSSPIPDSIGKFRTECSNRKLQQVLNGVKRILATHNINPELVNYQLDLSPVIRSWWYHSGLLPPNKSIFFKSRKDENGYISQMVQMDGYSAMNLRGDNFIEPILSQEDTTVTDTSLIEDYPHPLKQFGGVYKFKNPVTLAGFWPKDQEYLDFPHTCLLSTDCLQFRQKNYYKHAKPLDDVDNCLTNQVILTQFSWLNGLAMYHGFTPFDELTYPFTSQAITTDGQNWMFNIYQMNTHTFHRDFGGPRKNNICWSSGTIKLFDDYVGGEFKGVNDDAVKILIRFLSQRTSPEYTANLELYPLLGEDTRIQEEKDETMKSLRRIIEQRGGNWLPHMSKVPLYEHIFYRSPEYKNQPMQIRKIYHPKAPKCPKIFE